MMPPHRSDGGPGATRHSTQGGAVRRCAWLLLLMLACCGEESKSDLIGLPCTNQQDCDQDTYCEATNNDCGPGTCKERPLLETETGIIFDTLVCGCDGEIHIPPNAQALGVDHGPNSNCAPDLADMFPCNEFAICFNCSEAIDGDPDTHCDRTTLGGAACSGSSETNLGCRGLFSACADCSCAQESRACGDDGVLSCEADAAGNLTVTCSE